MGWWISTDPNVMVCGTINTTANREVLLAGRKDASFREGAMEDIDRLHTTAVDLAMRFAKSCQERNNLTLADTAFRAVLPTFFSFVSQDVEGAPLRSHIEGL